MKKLLVSIFFFVVLVQASAQPRALRSDITITPLVSVTPEAARIARDPASGNLFVLNMNGSIYEVVNAGGTYSTALRFTSAQHGISFAQGLAFLGNTMFVVGNTRQGDTDYFGRVSKGVLQANGTRTWSTVLSTQAYGLTNTAYDHGFSGIAISTDGNFIYITSGSRTDHGEVQSNGGARPGLREEPLTSAVFRIPVTAQNLVLQNNQSWLETNGYLYADGTRNSFDIAFAPNGQLFACENSGDRDDPEELNWIRQGRHYGFPWNMGGNENPMQFSGYDPSTDRLLNPNYGAVRNGYYYNDPSFPPKPAITFTAPILNVGPDADKYRDAATGAIRDASDLGQALATFTTHRSPLGLVFDKENLLIEEFKGDGFLLGWTAGAPTPSAQGPFEGGQDVLHINLVYDASIDNYTIQTKRIAEGFSNPVDAEMVGSVMYVLEHSGSSRIWKIQLPQAPAGPVVSVTSSGSPAEGGSTGTFTISGTGITTSTTVNYTLGGTATSGDYSANPALSGSVVLSPTQSSASFTISVIDDAVVDPGETLQLTLSPGSYAIGSSNAVLTFQDNEAAPCSGSLIVFSGTAPVINQSIEPIWANAPLSPISKLLSGIRTADFNGQWRALYDNVNLYLLIEVSDNSKRNDSGNSWWMDDAVEVFIDGNNSKRTTYDGLDDFQFGFRWNDNVIKVGSNSVNRTTGITYAIHNPTAGYAMEIAIPWSTLGITPSNGKQIGFDVQIDEDDNGADRDAQFAWFASTTNAFSNPSVFGTATLATCNLNTPVISNTSLPNGTQGSSYSASITASNNPTSFSATGLPTGLSMNTTTGVISGIPSSSGTYQVNLSATNASGTGPVKQLSLSISPNAVPVINNSSLPNATQGSAYSVTITASNNPSGFSATGLPGGLVINTTTGVISGTPSASGSFNVNLSASNASGTGPVKTLTLTVNGNSAPSINNTSLNTGNVGLSYAATISATNNPTSFGATGLPIGLAVNATSGVISGTPTRPGNYTVTITAGNAFGTGSKTLPMIINEPTGTVACLRTSQSMVIDGNVNESGWVLNKNISKNTVGTANNTGTFGVLWDNSNLYVAARILDANLFSDSGNPWEDDALEIYIDANNNKLSSYDGRDNQIIKSFNKTTVYTKLAVTGLQHASFSISGGYSIEVSIPWSQLGITAPANGTTIGFDVGYDDDDNGGTRDRQSVWNGTVNNYSSTSAFGTLVLSSAVTGSTLARVEVVDGNSPGTESDNEVIYWPNPVTDVLHLETDGTYKAIAVIDIFGKTQFVDRSIKGQTSIDVDLAHLGEGYFLVKLTGKQKTKVIRIFKTR